MRYKVTDTETGREGWLVETGGYVIGSQYVNPSWEIRWEVDDDDSEASDSDA